MIIRVTFHDSDYTQIIKTYFTRFKFCNYNYYYKNCKDLTEYRDKSIESEDLLKKVIFESSKLTEEDKSRFVDIIKESIKEWLKVNYNEDYNYLIKNLDVSYRNVCTDDDENGEVVYYFTNKDILIVS